MFHQNPIAIKQAKSKNQIKNCFEKLLNMLVHKWFCIHSNNVQDNYFCYSGVKCCVIVGGIDMMNQALMLAKKPHVIIATPGRLVDHLENTKGFHLRSLKFLVMDEADRILNMDFEQEVDKILKVCNCYCQVFIHVG